MAIREWRNDELSIKLTIEYDPLLVKTDSNTGIVSYQVRDNQIHKYKLYGASFTTNGGFVILIVNGTGMITAASTVYQIPPGQDFSFITTPNTWNSNY